MSLTEQDDDEQQQQRPASSASTLNNSSSNSNTGMDAAAAATAAAADDDAAVVIGTAVETGAATSNQIDEPSTFNNDKDETNAAAEFDTRQMHAKARINKLPSIKKPKLVFKTGRRIDKSLHENWRAERQDRGWTEAKVFVLPIMPSDQDEKNVFIEREFRCAFCDQLCDIEYLECKVCPKVFHTLCLYKRGHLNSFKVPLKLEWTCFDCSDLSKILTDEEIRKIINIYDELDFRRNCYVNYDDYMKIKRKMYEEDGEVLTKEKELLEKSRFKLIDKDLSGTITWSEFVEFEAADLLSKKNKIELSNFLTMKELVVAKKKFLEFDRDDTKMIRREDAKYCYMEFIDKLRKKLGPAFGAHLSNCADLFGLNPKTDIIVHTAKTIWPEFIRKLTILLLYDRKNLSVFEPRYWKPGIWYSIVRRPQHSYLLDRENSNSSGSFLPFLPNALQQQDKNLNGNKTKTSDSLFGVEQIMSDKMDVSKFKPHKLSEFGSIEFVIRSKSRHSSYVPQTSVEFTSRSEIDWDHVESVKRLKQTLIQNKARQLQEFSGEMSGSLRNESFRGGGGGDYSSGHTASYDEFKYDSVTRNIYEKFGRAKQFCDYPQKIPINSNNSQSGAAAHEQKLPDLKRIRAHRMRKMWLSDQWNQASQNHHHLYEHHHNQHHRNPHHHHHHYLNNQQHQSQSHSGSKHEQNGADDSAKFLNKILSLKHNS